MSLPTVRIKLTPVALIVFMLLNLHLLRNVSQPNYLMVLMAIYVPLVLLALSKVLATLRFRSITLWLLLFILTAFMAALSTFVSFGLDATFYATVRYTLTLPFVFVAYAFIDTEQKMRTALKLYVVFVALALVTIPLQYLIGPIPWFAEPGERANIVRYASLLGSLTSAGSVVPFALLILFMIDFGRGARITLLAMIFIGAMLSLQKAVVLGIALAVGFYFLLAGRRNIKRFLIVVAATALLLVVANYLLGGWSVWRQATGYVAAALQLDDTANLGGDVTIVQSMIDRLTSLPASSLADLYQFRGNLGWFIGGGFAMVGTSLMRPDESPFITAHNGYVDFFLIGGFLHLLAVVALFVELWLESSRMVRHDKAKGLKGEVPLIFLGICGISLVSLFFAGGLTFQPNTSVLLWLILGYVWRNQNLMPWRRGFIIQRSSSGAPPAHGHSKANSAEQALANTGLYTR